jgi:hypothetical protein
MAVTVMDINPLPFVTIDAEVKPTEEQLKFVRNSARTVTDALEKGATYTDNCRILDEEPMHSLRAEFERVLDVYLHDVIGVSTDVSLKVCSSIYVKSEPGHCQMAHKHVNGIVAGCYYIDKAPDEPLQVFSELQLFQPLNFVMPWGKDTKYNQEMTFINANPGQFVLFPANLFHLVDGTNSTHGREVIGFTAFPVGDFSKSMDAWVRYHGGRAGGYGTGLKIGSV